MMYDIVCRDCDNIREESGEFHTELHIHHPLYIDQLYIDTYSTSLFFHFKGHSASASFAMPR